MKKFLLSLACVLGLGAWANATTVKVNVADQFGSATTDLTAWTVDGVTITPDKAEGSTAPAFNQAGDARLYAKNTLTISASANIKSISFTISTAGLKRLTDVTPSVGAVEEQGANPLVWNGETTSVTFTVGDKATYGTDGAAKAGQFDFTEITIELDGESSGDQGGDEGGNEEGGSTDTPAFAMTSVIGSVVSGETYDIDGVVTGVCSRGFILTDNSGSILAYLGAATDYKVGDQIRAKATISSYGKALQIANTSTFEKLGEQTVTYPTPVAYDAAKIETAVARESDAIAEYVEFTGTVSVSGNYYNILVGSDKAQGSVYYATDDVKALLEDGKEVTIDGYFVSVSSAKYFNVVVTGVKVADEGGSDDNSTVTPETPAFDSIADFVAKAESGVAYIVNFPLTVGYAYNANIFVTDGKDFIQIYKSGLGLKQGDVIPAGWEATYTLYSSTTPELVPVDGIPAVTEGTFTAKEVELADVTNDLVNSVVIIKNVTFAEATPATKSNFEGTNGETTGSFRNNYAIDSVEAGTYDVEAVITIYNNAPSIYVISYTKSTTTSVSDINVENGAVEYFNLQGVRVANPENGIYVRRQGNKVSKVVIR
jgi:hypothetical protein